MIAFLDESYSSWSEETPSPALPIYAALIKAAETSSPVSGALTMFAFGVGTMGALLVLGLFSSTASPWLRRYSNQLAAIGVTLMGAYLLYHGIKVSMRESSMHH